MTELIVMAGHPYFACLDPTVRAWNGEWIVKWRDFETIKQDATFATLQEAVAFADRLRTPPLRVDMETDLFADCDRFWRECAEMRE